MVNIIERLIGPAMTDDEQQLLRSVRLPDPAVFEQQRDRLTADIEAAEREWDRLDRRADPAAYLAREPVAERLAQLRAQITPLPAQMAAAAHRRVAFVEAVRAFAQLTADVDARLGALLTHPPADADDRRTQLRELNQLSRLHVRVAAKLQTLSSDRRFREPPSAVRTLMDWHAGWIRECERLQLPGAKAAVVWPEDLQHLFRELERKDDRS